MPDSPRTLRTPPANREMNAPTAEIIAIAKELRKHGLGAAVDSILRPMYGFLRRSQGEILQDLRNFRKNVGLDSN